MADQTQRLEIATVKAEVGSNILYLFSNAAEDAQPIATESGEIRNLKQVIATIQEEGADKISFATTIYPTVAAGSAAVSDGAIFLVKSSEVDEIYSVWQKSGSSAVDTGKRALSSQAVEDAMRAATEASDAAQDAADIATARTARFLESVSTPPLSRDDGSPLQVGDRYVSTDTQAEYIYNADGWAANESLQAIADLKNTEDPTKGPALIGFKRFDEGAIARTIYEKELERCNVKDFGVVGNNIKDDTQAWENAIKAVGLYGGDLWVPPGSIFKLSGPLEMNKEAVNIVGASKFKSLFMQYALDSKILDIKGSHCSIEKLSFSYADTPLAGGTAVDCSGAYITVDKIMVRRADKAISWHEGVGGKLLNSDLLNYESVGLQVENLNDLFVHGGIYNAGSQERGRLGGLRLLNKVEAFVLHSVDILMGQYSMTMDAASNTIGNRPAYNKFFGLFCDSAALATQINKCVQTEFHGLWLSGGRVGVGSPGASVTNCDGIKFIGGEAFNCGGHGINVAASSKNVSFCDFDTNSNSATAGPGVAHGINFAPNTKNFRVKGGNHKNGLYSGTQGYGVFVSGGCDKFSINDADVEGNATGGILDGSAANADKKISGNIGYRTSNAGQAIIVSGTTSIVVAHGLGVTPRLQDLFLNRQGPSAGAGDIYVSNVTSTQFTINSGAAPSSNITVTWMARCSGA